jgi:TRAP transporter 4TM/12TM fusion protein
MSRIKKRDVLDTIISAIIIIIALYHLASIMWIIFPQSQTKIIHVFSGLIVVYLLAFQKAVGKKSTIRKMIALFLFCVSVVVSVYFFTHASEMELRLGLPTKIESIMGFIMLILVLESTGRAWGRVIPCVVVIALFYGYFGRYLPGIFAHGGLSFGRLMGYSCTYFQGVYGSLTALSIREVFVFIMLGAFLSCCGGIGFFMKLGEEIGGSLRSRGAMTAIISSSLMGTVSGSITSNVATTGCVTIPMMIESGYTKEYAGAVEAAASTGGQIMPPVMGAAAFIIADHLGISYGSVCLAAMFPAFIYYSLLMVSVQIQAVKTDIPVGSERKHRLLKILKEDGYLMVCLVVLIAALSTGMAVARAGIYSIFSLMIVTFIKKWIVHGNDHNAFAKDYVDFIYRSLIEGATGGVKLGLIMAALGVMVEMFVVTGFAQRVSFQMVELAGNSVILLLTYVALTCLLFGCGMPTTGAYLTVALLAAPALVGFGIPELSAHFFVFYYALMAAVTPPIGSAAIVASGLSGGNYMKTAVYAVRLTLPGFVMPFYFVFRPALLLLNTSTFDTILTAIVVLSSLVALECIIGRYMFTRIPIWQSPILVAVIVLSFFNTVTTSFICIALFAVVFFFQFTSWKKANPAIATATIPVEQIIFDQSSPPKI